MPRRARIVVPGLPHHVTHRGNRREPIFFEEGDKEDYLRLLLRASRKYGADIWAYCLMDNHVHLLLVPRDAQSLARTINRAHAGYARMINSRNGWTGHLFANRYYSAVLDETHLWNTARYVERNPVRAGLAVRAEDYPFSSARAHVSGSSSPLLAPDRPFPGPIGDWSAWLAEAPTDAQIERIRRNTRTGRPIGDTAFVDALEALIGEPIDPRPSGPVSLWERLSP